MSRRGRAASVRSASKKENKQKLCRSTYLFLFEACFV
jgi:hypothetical protein